MTTITTTDTTPRVWIGCLACYNTGRLVGDWHDAIGAADVTTTDVHGRAVDAVLALGEAALRRGGLLRRLRGHLHVHYCCAHAPLA